MLGSCVGQSTARRTHRVTRPFRALTGSAKGLQTAISFVMEAVGTKRKRVRVAEDEFLSVQDCAKILKMSTRYVYDLLRQRKGPPFRRFGGRYRIRYSSFMNWATKPENRG